MNVDSVHSHIRQKLKRPFYLTIISGILLGLVFVIVYAGINLQIDVKREASYITAQANLIRILNDQKPFTLPIDTSHVPYSLSQDTLIPVIAKNQPAVVLVLMLYCGDMTLQSGSQSLSETNVCGGNVGSGSIISSDGYIATNGHIVNVDPATVLVNSLKTHDERQNYLKFLVTTGLLASDKANKILADLDANTDVSLQNFTSTAELLNSSILKISNASTQYAIQLGRNSVELLSTSGRITPNYIKGVVNASLIAENYDATSSNVALTTGDFKSSDVAVLKIAGDNYPVVKLGSVDAIRPGSRLTAIGFPWLLGDLTSVTQGYTLPSLTQGNVVSVSSPSQYGGYIILDTTVPLAQGNSGGPVFDDSGLQIGINTYAQINCPDLKCFGNGQARDIADLKALLIKSNIKLQSGTVSGVWDKALSEYSQANYSAALQDFQKVQTLYPNNYLAQPLINATQSRIGVAGDDSMVFQARDVVIDIGFVAAGVFLLLIFGISYLFVWISYLHYRDKHRISIKTIL
jgi:S1-C subfamily serine protease